MATAVDDGTFETIDDLARVFGEEVEEVFWSTRSVGEATSPTDYPTLSEYVAFRYGDFEAECGRFVLRMTLPGVAVTQDEMDEPYERFLVKLEPTPGGDGRIRLGTRPDVNAFDHRLAGPGFFDGVVTVRGQDGHLRLVDGGVGHEGRLEIFLNEQWGTICGDYWTDVESGVACRQIGYPGAESNTGRFLKAHFGQGSGPIWLDNVLCDGNELLLTDCRRIDEGADVGGHNCRHSEDVGIRCLVDDTASSTTGSGLSVVPLAWPGNDDPTSIDSLDLSNQGVTDLGGLDAFVNLRRLGLAGNAVADLSPLADLPDLEVLLLDGNAIADLGPLTHLTRMRYLVLAGNQVQDVAPLADMAALERLDLIGNPVHDLSPLGDLGNLLWLRLSESANNTP